MRVLRKCSPEEGGCMAGSCDVRDRSTSVFFFPFFLVFIEPTWRQCLWGDWCCVQAQSKHTDDEPYKMAGLWSAFEVSKWNMRCLTVWLTLGSNPRGAFAFWPGCPACSWSWMMLKHIGFYCSERKKREVFQVLMHGKQCLSMHAGKLNWNSDEWDECLRQTMTHPGWPVDSTNWETDYVAETRRQVLVPLRLQISWNWTWV